MPLAPPNVAATLGTNLLAVGHVGTDLPRFVQAVGLGVSNWAAAATVSVTGTGASGTGQALLPMTVPAPLILTSVQASFVENGILGLISPLTALGLSNGLFAAFPQGVLQATVVGVGSGAGVARVSSAPAFTFFQAAFSSLGMKGTATSQMALALGGAFDKIFAAFSIAIPIVGPSGPSAGVGSGTGKIV